MVWEIKVLVKAKAFISHVALHKVFVFGLMLHFWLGVDFSLLGLDCADPVLVLAV